MNYQDCPLTGLVGTMFAQSVAAHRAGCESSDNNERRKLFAAAEARYTDAVAALPGNDDGTFEGVKYRHYQNGHRQEYLSLKLMDQEINAEWHDYLFEAFNKRRRNAIG